MASSGGRRGNPGLYGAVPAAPGPAGMAPRLLEFADELRREGVAVGTSELLDAFEALDAVSWTSQEDFREALACIFDAGELAAHPRRRILSPPCAPPSSSRCRTF